MGAIEILTFSKAPGEDYVADMAEEGEPLLIVDADDERLRRRNSGTPTNCRIPPVANALLVPLLQDDSEIGVPEAYASPTTVRLI